MAFSNFDFAVVNCNLAYSKHIHGLIMYLGWHQQDQVSISQSVVPHFHNHPSYFLL